MTTLQGGRMISVKKLAIAATSGALALGLLVAPSAQAENNYAPGLPVAEPGVPNNPPQPAKVSFSVVLVSSAVAERTEPTLVRRPVAPTLADAPRPSSPVRTPITVVSRGLETNTVYVAQIKRKGGSYATLGSVIPLNDGTGVLPTFRPSKTGTFIIALVDQRTGKPKYIKVRVQRR